MAAPSPDLWRALSPHLDEALGMTGEERSAWLSCLRAKDPSLGDQLELLLGHHRALQERFAGLPRESGLTGQTLGAYRLIAQIGQRGMGSVWLAERNDARFERRVAVKLLKIALIDGKYLGYADRQGIHRQVVDTGETLGVPPPAGIEPLKTDWVFAGWYPDSTEFIASVAIPGKPDGGSEGNWSQQGPNSRKFR
jgi:hypothetical protein